MKKAFAILLSATLMLGIAGAAQANKSKKRQGQPAAQKSSSDPRRTRQSDAQTFDETQYYERDSNRIPFGTRTWWDRKTLEAGQD